MKNTSLVLSVIALAVALIFGILSLTPRDGKKVQAPAAGENSAAGATAGSIVYYNLDRVLSEYDKANDLRSIVETKVNGINDEVNRRGNRLQKDVNDFQDKINKGLLLRSDAEARGQQLTQRQQEFQNYANQKQQEIMEEQQVLTNQIADAIKQYIDKFIAEKRYAMVIAVQGDILPMPINAADSTYDVTDELLKGLNDEYILTKGNATK